MLITKTCKIKWNPRNKKHLEDLGYSYSGIGQFVEVDVEDMQKNSGYRIKLSCDYCGKTYDRALSHHTRVLSKDILKKDSCLKCAPIKQKEQLMETHGVENQFQLESVKEKIRETSLKKFGVASFTKTEEYKEKSKATSQQKYGVEHYTQTEEYKERVKNTNLEKYGVINVGMVDEFKQKGKNTLKNKYGYEYTFQVPSIREKGKTTMLEKYGVDHPTQSKEMVQKAKNTSMERYGVEFPSQSEEIKGKTKNTLIEKYGVENIIHVPGAIEKRTETIYKYGSCPTSSQQLALFELLEKEKYNVVLNFPLGKMNFDIALFYEDIKIDIEYDAWHWHKDNSIFDRRRDEYSKSQGWKILRILSGKKLPSKELLIDSINKLINTNRLFTKIVLDDWGDKEVS
jgi:very-short-patch-repair endonuclease